MEEQKGLVLKGVGGFYTVAFLDHPHRPVVQCVLRGKLKKMSQERPVVAGDHVLLVPAAREQWVINEVLPRRILLTRPVVANVDLVVVVLAVTSPEPDLFLLDRLLVQVEHLGLEAIICFNKCDLATEYRIQKVARPYRQIGYQVLTTSAVEGRNIPRLRSLLAGKVATMAGPSGVGKSALINALVGDRRRLEGEVSRKTLRGRHTTREVELLPLSGGGFLADTPGFSALDLSGLTTQDLASCFPEFNQVSVECRFSSCLHEKEPDCKVREAASSGQIPSFRYQHYLELLAEIRKKQRW